MNWQTIIGLEVHVQLATQSKLFCGCSTAFGDTPNTNVCPVCLGLPGALPASNEEAVRLGLRAALAFGFTVHRTSFFARKNYFYPDLPKGYQISQFDSPLATDGELSLESPDRGRVVIGMTRLHLEEDAGKSLHDRVPDKTAVDFNRSGVPLAEIVSEPEIRSPAEARAYLTALKQILQYLDVSDCNMEDGRLRVDANISVRSDGETALGVKQEIKNMNSFAGVERALEDIRQSQVEILEAGGAVERNTFTAATGELRIMRTKEESHDYRYFPEPDLPPLMLTDDGIEEERMALPELPEPKRARFQEQYGLSAYDARVLCGTRNIASYFEEVTAAGADPKTAAHWVMGSVLQDAKDNEGALRVDASRLAALVSMVRGQLLSNQAAKRVFVELTTAVDSPEIVASQLGLTQVSDDDQLSQWVSPILDAHPEEAKRLRQGEVKLMDFFMGRVMKASQGRADPQRVREILRAKLRPTP